MLTFLKVFFKFFSSKEELLLCESVQYPMEDTIDIIVENYEKNKFQKNEHLLIDKIL